MIACIRNTLSCCLGERKTDVCSEAGSRGSSIYTTVDASSSSSEWSIGSTSLNGSEEGIFQETMGSFAVTGKTNRENQAWLARKKTDNVSSTSALVDSPGFVHPMNGDKDHPSCLDDTVFEFDAGNFDLKSMIENVHRNLDIQQNNTDQSGSLKRIGVAEVDPKWLQHLQDARKALQRNIRQMAKDNFQEALHRKPNEEESLCPS